MPENRKRRPPQNENRQPRSKKQRQPNKNQSRQSASGNQRKGNNRKNQAPVSYKPSNNKNDAINHKKKKGSKKDGKQPLTAEAAYSKYRVKKAIVFASIIVIALALIFFGTYNTFFKHQLTKNEAAVYTNKFNAQTQMQQWDASVQGYLERNLKDLLNNIYSSNESTNNITNNGNNADQSFSIDNIGIERNIEISDNAIISIFSVDIIDNYKNVKTRQTFSLTLKEDENNETGGLIRASELELSSWVPHTQDDTASGDNQYEVYSDLSFEDIDEDKEISESFEKTCENYFTLAYNDKQSVKDIYVGKQKLEYNGTFISINSCKVYKDSNKLGYNAYVTYTLRLTNGVAYNTSSYMHVKKNSTGSYVIDKIL